MRRCDRLVGAFFTRTPAARHAADEALADAQPAGNAEPLRILLLGRANAGKSSLINALFGEVTTATDVLPDTTIGITPFRLDRARIPPAARHRSW